LEGAWVPYFWATNASSHYLEKKKKKEKRKKEKNSSRTIQEGVSCPQVTY
jgi:hypothetical protein